VQVSTGGDEASVNQLENNKAKTKNVRQHIFLFLPCCSQVDLHLLSDVFIK